MKKIFQYIAMAVAVVAMASCSQEEMFEPVAPQGMRFIVSDFPAYDDPQTRVIGIPEDGKTEWKEGDEILIIFKSPKCGVQSATLTYTKSEWRLPEGVTFNYIQGELELLEISAMYSPAYVIENGEFVQKQPFGTTEYLYGNCTLSLYGTCIRITFVGGRNYSRLRIAAGAGQSLQVTAKNFTPAGATESGEYTYTLTADENGNAFLYGTFAEGATVTVKDGDTELATHTFDVATEAEKSYALFAGVTVDLSKLTETYVINDSKHYRFTGTGSHGIKVESGNPTITLNNVSIIVGEGSAIDIASGSNATIQVLGDNTISTSKTDFDETDTTSGGIFVAEGGTVNITSNGTDNVLRAHGTLAAAIGGKYVYKGESYNAGSINISNVTVYAYTNDFCAVAIGAAGDEGTCGTINITNAVVYAYGAGNQWTSTPGIGSAQSYSGWPETTPVVIISDSEIHTFRFNQYSDYIGYCGDVSGEEAGFHATGSINCGEGGSVKSSTIYCYTGLDATTTDKVVTYDADGNPTEQVAE